MTKTFGISTRSKFFILLFLLWTAPAFGGSPDASQSPECKAAVKQVDSVESDVDAAFEAHGQAMDKTDQAIEELTRAIENIHKAVEARSTSVPRDRLRSVEEVLRQARDKEQSAQDRLKQTLKVSDKRIADAMARCGGSR